MKVCKRKKRIGLICFIFAIVLFLLPVATTVTVSAAGYDDWFDENDGDTLSFGSSKSGLNKDAQDELDKDPTWVERMFSAIVRVLNGGISQIVDSTGGADLDKVIFGRSATGVQVSSYQFGLEVGNPYGSLAAMIYGILRNIIFAVFAVQFVWMLLQYLLNETGSARANLKGNVYNFVFMFVMLYAVPILTQLVLLIRDSALKLVLTAANQITGHNSSVNLIYLFAEIAVDDRRLLSALLWFFAICATTYLIWNYLNIAIRQMFLFGAFPVVAWRSFSDKGIFMRWTSWFFTQLFIPVLDSIGFLLVITMYKTKSISSATTRGTIALMIFFSIVPCRTLILQLFGAPAAASRSSLAGLLLLARALSRKPKDEEDKTRDNDNKEKPNSEKDSTEHNTSGNSTITNDSNDNNGGLSELDNDGGTMNGGDSSSDIGDGSDGIDGSGTGGIDQGDDAETMADANATAQASAEAMDTAVEDAGLTDADETPDTTKITEEDENLDPSSNELDPTDETIISEGEGMDLDDVGPNSDDGDLPDYGTDDGQPIPLDSTGDDSLDDKGDPLPQDGSDQGTFAPNGDEGATSPEPIPGESPSVDPDVGTTDSDNGVEGSDGSTTTITNEGSGVDGTDKPISQSVDSPTITEPPMDTNPGGGADLPQPGTPQARGIGPEQPDGGSKAPQPDGGMQKVQGQGPTHINGDVGGRFNFGASDASTPTETNRDPSGLRERMQAVRESVAHSSFGEGIKTIGEYGTAIRDSVEPADLAQLKKDYQGALRTIGSVAGTAVGIGVTAISGDPSAIMGGAMFGGVAGRGAGNLVGAAPDMARGVAHEAQQTGQKIAEQRRRTAQSVQKTREERMRRAYNNNPELRNNVESGQKKLESVNYKSEQSEARLERAKKEIAQNHGSSPLPQKEYQRMMNAQQKEIVRAYKSANREESMRRAGIDTSTKEYQRYDTAATNYQRARATEEGREYEQKFSEWKSAKEQYKYTHDKDERRELREVLKHKPEMPEDMSFWLDERKDAERALTEKTLEENYLFVPPDGQE